MGLLSKLRSSYVSKLLADNVESILFIVVAYYFSASLNMWLIIKILFINIKNNQTGHFLEKIVKHYVKIANFEEGS